MERDFSKKLNAAITSGWWLILGLAILVTLVWIFYLFAMSNQPQWILSLWGPNLTWPQIQFIWITAIAFFKLMMIGVIVVVTWLMLWRKQMKS